MPMAQARIDLEKMVAYKDDEPTLEKQLIRAKKNQKQRPSDCQKSINAHQFCLLSKFNMGSRSVNIKASEH